MTEKKKVVRLGILTGGGDCPGLNAVLRAAAKTALVRHSLEVVGFFDGYEGLIHDRARKLDYESVSGILTVGGTILGTSNRANPFAYPAGRGRNARFEDVSERVAETYRRRELDGVVIVGGDGTLSIAAQLAERWGINVVGIPKTIDNDLPGTDYTVGFFTAVDTAAEAIDKIHDTAQSHHRVMIVEVMGRNAGWLALYAGLASGGDVILIPEIPYDVECIAERVRWRSRRGKRFTIIVVAEGARARGEDMVVLERVRDKSESRRLGGIGYVLEEQLKKVVDVEIRTTILGHVQRGGSPCTFDRVLATCFGKLAGDLAAAGRFGFVTVVKGRDILPLPLREATGRQRLVEPDDPLIAAVLSTGGSMGVEE
ncbi:MAG: ATP-dependent 6-phosphofructokinase [Planctomycetota bacterium]